MRYLIQITKVFYLSILGVYRELLEKHNPETKAVIEKDLHRTFPDVEEFKISISSGKNRLYNVLKAYSEYDPEVGYCQGMNYLAAMLLKYIDNEELAFFAFIKVMQEFSWREVYIDPMNKLSYLIENLIDQLEIYVPNVIEHLRNLGIELNGLFSHIFLTAFIYKTPLDLAAKIFDLFILEKEDALIIVAINMFRVMQDKILTYDSMVMIK